MISVKVKAQAARDGLPHNTEAVARTGKDFAWLRGALAKECPGAIVPPVPRVCTLLNADAARDEKPATAVALETFLKRLFSHKDLAGSKTLKTFCLAKAAGELETCGPALCLLLRVPPPRPPPLRAQPLLRRPRSGTKR